MAVNNYFGKSHQLCCRMADDSIASHADVFKGSSCVPATGMHGEPLRTPSAWETNESTGKQNVNHRLSKYLSQRRALKNPTPERKASQSIIFLWLPKIDKTPCSQKTRHRKDKRIKSAVIF